MIGLRVALATDVAQLRLQGIVKQFDGATTPAIPSLDLNVESGTMVALVGPSGCGKSTTLRMVAGLEEVTKGAVFIDERDVTNLPPAERDIAMVFQSYALYPHMTVFENMAFGLRIRKVSDADITTRVHAAATSLDLMPYLARLPKALSGGQRQRVAIGRALVREPRVFLFDEPLSNLDAKLRGEMRREIARIHRQTQTTSLYVTHDQIEAMTLANVIVVMRDGRIQQTGTPQDIYRTPATKFVAGFFGTPSMNFVTADISTVGDGRRVANASGLQLPLPAATVLTSDQVVVGLRPEGIALIGQTGDIELQGAVTSRELLGSETVLYVETAAGPLTVRANADANQQPGEHVALWMNPSALHIFDRCSELRV
jgi:ABC-type sugar transport system ATPase subunit